MGRQRYRNRKLDPDTLDVIDSVSTFYDGDQPYADGGGGWRIGFEPGIGKIDPWTTDSTAANTQYYHGDLIGTTRFMTDAGGNQVDEAVYTAFGERVSGTMADLGDRYGYAGAWGYQAHEDFPFLHVGHRYYDPSTGRFLQRDPIGILGGLNVYQYVLSQPTGLVDLDGSAAVAVGAVGVGAGAAAGAAGVVAAGTLFCAKLGVDLIREMSHLKRIKQLQEYEDALDRAISRQLDQLRNTKDPKARERIKRTIPELLT